MPTILDTENQSDSSNDDEMNDGNEGMSDDGEEVVTHSHDGKAKDILKGICDNSPSARNSVE